MKIKIINQDHQYFGQEFKVIKMNFEGVIVNINGENQIINRRDTKIIAESQYEETIERVQDLLKIRIEKGISIALYTALEQCIVNAIHTKIDSIDVIKDDYRLISKKRWKKNIVVVVNSCKPFGLEITGLDFDNRYTIKIAKIQKNEFQDNSKMELQNINKQIKNLENKRELYEKYIGEGNLRNCK